MRILKFFFLFLTISLLGVSCATKTPKDCCGQIGSAYTKQTEPMFEQNHPVELPDSYYKDDKDQFDPNSVRIVDQIGRNLLVRGNHPISNGQFAYEQLKQAIDAQLSMRRSKSLSPNFLLINISLMQLGEFSLENEWFARNSHFGCYWNRPVVGSLLSPDKFTKHERNAYFAASDIIELNQFIDKIHSLLSSNCGRPVVVYIHCKSGKNRTGEVIACYRMKYMGMSYKEAVKANTDAFGEIHEINQNAIKWYALYLKEVEGMNSIGDIPGVDNGIKSK